MDAHSVLQGSTLQAECSFEEFGPYQEKGKEWDSLHIDSVTMLDQQTESAYTADTTNISEVRWSHAAI